MVYLSTNFSYEVKRIISSLKCNKNSYKSRIYSPFFYPWKKYIETSSNLAQWIHSCKELFLIIHFFCFFSTISYLYLRLFILKYTSSQLVFVYFRKLNAIFQCLCFKSFVWILTAFTIFSVLDSIQVELLIFFKFKKRHFISCLFTI